MHCLKTEIVQAVFQSSFVAQKQRFTLSFCSMIYEALPLSALVAQHINARIWVRSSLLIRGER